MAVAQGEGVAVHHRGADEGALGCVPLHGGHEALRALGAVLHHGHPVGSGHGKKAGAAEQGLVFRLGVDEKTGIARGKAVVDQDGDDLAHQVLAPQPLVHGEALEDVPAAAAAAQDLVRIVVHEGGGEFDVVVAAQMMFVQKGGQLLPLKGELRVDIPPGIADIHAFTC